MISAIFSTTFVLNFIVSLLFDFGVGTAILTGWLSFCYPSNNFLVHPEYETETEFMCIILCVAIMPA
jgi:hypothetical protein